MANTLETFEEAWQSYAEFDRWESFLAEENLGQLTDGYLPEYDQFLIGELRSVKNRTGYSYDDLRAALNQLEAENG